MRALPSCLQVEGEIKRGTNENSNETRHCWMGWEKRDESRNQEGQPYQPDQPQKVWRAAFFGLRGCICLVWIAYLYILHLRVPLRFLFSRISCKSIFQL